MMLIQSQNLHRKCWLLEFLSLSPAEDWRLGPDFSAAIKKGNSNDLIPYSINGNKRMEEKESKMEQAKGGE
jgi:hypothetical protein